MLALNLLDLTKLSLSLVKLHSDFQKVVHEATAVECSCQYRNKWFQHRTGKSRNNLQYAMAEMMLIMQYKFPIQSTLAATL